MAGGSPVLAEIPPNLDFLTQQAFLEARSDKTGKIEISDGRWTGIGAFQIAAKHLERQFVGESSRNDSHSHDCPSDVSMGAVLTGGRATAL